VCHGALEERARGNLRRAEHHEQHLEALDGLKGVRDTRRQSNDLAISSSMRGTSGADRLGAVEEMEQRID
jgi:hypothetical protein